MGDFTHVNDANNPCMVDVGDKAITTRVATAKALVYLPEEVMNHFQGNEINSKKGPVFHTAIIAGTMGAKKTSELIPFCHPLQIDGCDITIEVNTDKKVEISCTVKTTGKTGIEMEALTGASIAALTIYDMCKAFSHEIVIESCELLFKTGGKSDYKK
ncbi:MAG: cyclic pyranopterin monophosphate synthase MoaC [Bacteriovoracaceae bacterium]|nr:cyclic pyranopterin monophosphate synthase MoaC [Bacteriovoracaceae bacterium]